MNLTDLKRICIAVLLFTTQINLPAQVKDSKWLLVDSVNYNELDEDSKIVLDSILPSLHTKQPDSLVLKNLFYITENISDMNVWPKYNDYMARFLASKPDTGLYLRFKGIVLTNSAYIAEHRDQNFVSALDLYSKAYAFLERSGSLADMAAPLNNMATIYQRFGNMQKSLELNFRALNILEKANDKNGIGFSQNNIAHVYSKLNNYEKAKEYLRKSYRIRLELGNKNQIAQSLNNIGGVFLNEFKVDSALPYFERSLAIAIEKKNKRQEAICYNNISICYRDMKQFDKALDYSKRGLKLKLESNDIEGLCHSYQGVGATYFLMGDLKNARNFYEKGFELAQENNIPEMILALSKCMYDLNKKEGRTAEALENHLLYTSMKDSLNNRELQKLSFQKQFEYEYNKKSFADSLKTSEEKLLEETRHQQVVQKQRFFIIGGIAGFVLMAAIAAISLVAFRQKKRSHILINKQKEEVEHQKNIIEEKQKEIIDSINYAKRIQSTLLANDKFITEHVEDNFVFFKPKDIVSGDFYWATVVGSSELGVRRGDIGNSPELFYLAVCDSTGHGVPGAFMSLLNIGFLSEAIKEKNIHEPNKVFDYVRARLVEGISKEGQKDGFDGILLCFDKTNKKITYAAANNGPVLISDGNVSQLKKDKMPVGKGERAEPFTLFTLEAKPGDILYLFTDGFIDQFGGPKGKKFMSRQFEALLLSFNKTPMKDQSAFLEDTFVNWVGELEQVDDVLVMGIKL